MGRKLYRSTRDRVFGGVCAGLSEYAQVDKGLLRFLTAVAILATLVIPGLIAYIVCVLVIPTEEAVLKEQAYYENGEKPPQKTLSPENTRLVIGIVLILIGAVTILRRWMDLRYAFPALLVIIGAVLVYKNWRHIE